jgi:putative ABC transport system permease protein
VSLSVVLLLGAGIVMRSFIRLVETDLRVDTSRLLSARVSFAPGRRQTADERQRFYRDALERISRLPGIAAATFVNGVAPFGGQRSDLAIDGEPASPNQRALVRYSTEGFRETVGMRLVAGRDLTAAEIDGARKVALVNETFVRRYFDKQNPLGRVIELARLKTLSTPVADPRFEIVGVVSDVINQDPRRPVEPEALISSMFRAAGPLTLNVRTEDEPGAIWNLLRAEVRAIDDQAALTNMNVLDQLLRTELYAQPRFVLIILGMFAATGLTLVALGIYGVLAYTVSQQTREIAIRVAMGGERRDVLRHVMGMGVRLVAIGVGVGIVASLGANRLLHSQLWNTSPYDLPTHVTVVAVILAVGVVACLIPARRAMRVDPIVALRHD